MLAYFWIFCHYMQELMRKIFWMGRHKTDSFYSLYLTYFFQKVSKIFIFIKIRVYILSQKCYLFKSFPCQLFYFLNDILWGTASFTARRAILPPPGSATKAMPNGPPRGTCCSPMTISTTERSCRPLSRAWNGRRRRAEAR